MKNLRFIALAILTLAGISSISMAQAPNLGAAGDFALFTSVGAVTNTGALTFITGNVGSNSGSSTGFGNVNGVMHTSDGVTAAATADLIIATNSIDTTTATGSHAPALGNDTFTAGVYTIAGDATLNGQIILDAQNDPDAVFIFKISATFSTAVASEVILINGALSCNVFWRADGAINIGGLTVMRGTVIAKNGAIDMASDVKLDGRVLSTSGAITLLNSSVKIPPGCGRPILTGPASPDLKSAACYAIFSSIGEVTNAGITTVKGDIGTNSGLATGYNPLLVNGMIHPIPDPSTTAAAADLVDAYNYLNNLTYDIELLYPAQFGNNLVLTPHTYRMNGAPNFVGKVTLNGEGNANAVFVIQIKGALSTGTFSEVELINGTQAKNVYWSVDGAVSISDYSVFKGTIIANNGAIDLATGVNLEGRILSTTGLVTTNASTVTSDLVCSPLPLSWLYFRGKAIRKQVVLEWATANEVNVDYFTIEKSRDAKTFSVLTTVKSEANEFTKDNVYSLTDDQPFSSTYYRVSQTDFDGKQNWFKIINIKSGAAEDFKATHFTNGNTLYIQTSGASAGQGSIEMYSMDGRMVVSKQIAFSDGKNSFQIHHSLSKGVYILLMRSQDGQVFRDKISVQ